MRVGGLAQKGVFLNLLKGMAIGVGNAVPGVSGGTIAVVTNIYDRTVGAISGFFRKHGGWKSNSLFLAPLGAGAAIGVFLFAQVIDRLLEAVPEQTFFLFIGLIVGSAPFLYKKAVSPVVAGGQASRSPVNHPANYEGEPPPSPRARFRLWYLLPFALALSALLVIEVVGRPEPGSGFGELSLTTVLVIFVSGAIGAATMIVPGVSGSFLLLVLGVYGGIIDAARELDVLVLGVFAVGAAVGIVSVARLIDWLIRNAHRPTYWAILGLVAGSVVNIWPGLTIGLAGVFSLLAFGFGVGLALLLGAERKERARGATQG